ncbi:radical SAM domain protein [Enterobacter hormaechei subsp. xiangfangensis]|nr:radical SAM domain protein [Enterobacter hormaechei subsp. xiangfangensis]
MQSEGKKMIFNIQRYSTHDGPGIRTVVFLKGCSLGCRWCQNPESRSRSRDVLFDARLCLDGCDLCQQAAPGCIERALNGLVIHREKLSEETLDALPVKASHDQGIHTAVETCLHVPWHYIEPSLPYVDLFLADLKHVDGDVFKQWMDGSAKRILDNLKRLARPIRAADPGLQEAPAIPTSLPMNSASTIFIFCRITRWA